jgi:hypothetical protein
MDHSEDQSLPDYMTKLYTALFMDRDFIKAHELVASGQRRPSLAAQEMTEAIKGDPPT